MRLAWQTINQAYREALGRDDVVAHGQRALWEVWGSAVN